jgi:hypothetical protein
MYESVDDRRVVSNACSDPAQTNAASVTIFLAYTVSLPSSSVWMKDTMFKDLGM